MKRLQQMAFPLLLAGLVGCGVTDAKPDAEALASTYFSAARSMSFDTISELYGEQFYQQISREEWERLLTRIWKKLGPPGKFELQAWRVNAVASTNGVGTYVVLQYAVSYEKYPVTETLTVFKPASGGPTRIVGHYINSTGLALE
ncbi:MAG: DUF4019 domain-containing protein [Candidatus Methylomirabilales bacterium]